MMSDADFLLIDKYLNHELNKNEVDDFEKRLATDSRLAKELELVKGMGRVAKHRDDVDATISLTREIGQKYKQEAKVIPIYKRRKMIWVAFMGAASILLLILFSNLFSKNSYQEFFQHQQLSGIQGESSVNLKKAIKDYNAQNYKSALSELEKITQEAMSDNPEFELAKGICYLELNQFEKATLTFNHIIQTQQIYKNQGFWYLALTALKQEDYKNCKKYLSKIEPNSPYFQKAKQLLELILSK